MVQEIGGMVANTGGKGFWGKAFGGGEPVYKESVCAPFIDISFLRQVELELE